MRLMGWDGWEGGMLRPVDNIYLHTLCPAMQAGAGKLVPALFIHPSLHSTI